MRRLRTAATRTLTALALALIAAGGIATLPPTTSAAATVTTLPPTGSVLQHLAPIFMGRSWHMTEMQAVTLAQQSDLIVAPDYLFTPYLAAMRQANRSLHILVYINGTYDENKNGNTYPSSWYERTTKNARIRSRSFGLWLMDPAIKGWQQAVAGQCRSLLASSGYDGCFVDSLGLAAFYPGYDTGLPANPSTGAVWNQSAWLQATTAIAAGVQAVNPAMPVVANGLGNGSQYFSGPAPTNALLNATHIGMAQTFVRPQNGSVNRLRPVSEWLQDVRMLSDAESHGNAVLAQTQLFVPASAAEQARWHRFSLATFLLGANGLSYFSFVAADTNSAIAATSAMDHVAIGLPVGPMQQKGAVYERQFTGGVVVVNPTSRPAHVSLTGTYRNLEGATVSSETLPAGSGDVFLLQAPRAAAGMLQMDAYGGIHSLSPADSSGYPRLLPLPLARGMVAASRSGGYVLDGFGGVHAFGSADPRVRLTAYWPGWDIARGIALLPGGSGGYVLDASGGLHPFATGHHSLPPAITGAPYWPGWDIARALVITGAGRGYVLDAFGGVHAFGGARQLKASAYWPGIDIARSLVIAPGGRGGYVLDGFGGLHAVGDARPVAAPAYWPGFDVARSLVLEPGQGARGWFLDACGGVHAFGGAPNVVAAWYTGGELLSRALGIG